MEADVLRISKMWYFLGVALFKDELLPVEVGSNVKWKRLRKEVDKLRRIQNL